MVNKFFMFDPLGGIKFFGTAEAARIAAEEVLELFRDESAEGWSDEVTEVCWGEVRQQVEETSRRPACAEYPAVLDEIVDYGFKDV